MSEATPPVQEGPGPGAEPPEPSLDASMPASTDAGTASPVEPVGAAPSSSQRGRTSRALRRVTGATVMIALVALLVGAALGYAFGRATTSSPAYDQAGKTRPGQMAPGAGPWYHFPQGQGDDHGRMGPGRGGQGGNEQDG